MRLVVAEFMSLDGVIEEPMWTFPYWTEEIAQFKHAELFASDGLLLGRMTYEGFAQSWPGQRDEQGYADRMNELPKYVVTTTLESGSWGTTSLIQSNVCEEITRIKQQEGGNLLVFGSGRLAQTLVQHNLVDQYNLLVYPIVLGNGQRLFEDGTQTQLRLVDTRMFCSGVVALIYEADSG